MIALLILALVTLVVLMLVGFIFGCAVIYAWELDTDEYEQKNDKTRFHR